MKKLIIALLVLSSATITTKAQVKTLFEGQSFEARWLLKDSIKEILPGDFSYVGFDSGSNYSTSAYAFHFMDTTGHELVIQFSKNFEGKNEDLNIHGKPVISNVKIFGNYMPIFKIWQRYFDEKADMVEVQKKQYASTGSLRLQKESRNWYIYKG